MTSYFCIPVPCDVKDVFLVLVLEGLVSLHTVVGGEAPLQGPKSGLLSNTRNRFVRGDTRADKARDFAGKAPGGRAAG